MFYHSIIPIISFSSPSTYNVHCKLANSIFAEVCFLSTTGLNKVPHHTNREEFFSARPDEQKGQRRSYEVKKRQFSQILPIFSIFQNTGARCCKICSTSFFFHFKAKAYIHILYLILLQLVFFSHMYYGFFFTSWRHIVCTELLKIHT